MPTERIVRVVFCVHENHLVALHGFTKKTQRTSPQDIATARRRLKELEVR